MCAWHPERRTRATAVRLTDTEHAKLYAEARKQNRTVADYIRHALFRTGGGSQQIVLDAPASEREREQAVRSARREGWRQLIKIGTNVNQIARRVNASGGKIPPETTRVLAEVRDVLTSCLEAIDERTGRLR